MSNRNSEVDKMIAYLESDEGKAKMEAHVKEWAEKKERYQARVDRFHEKYKDQLDLVMERLLEKYGSDKYVNKEYKLGYEPREDLLWLMFNYAEKYCLPCTDEQYFNDFTGCAYYIGSYVLQVMHGQGSVLRVDKGSAIG